MKMTLVNCECGNKHKSEKLIGQQCLACHKVITATVDEGGLGIKKIEPASQKELAELAALSAELDAIREERDSQSEQVGGDHYKMPIQPIDFIVKNNIPYREANVIKYVCRWREKGGKEDLKKAIHYLEMIMGD